MSAKRPHKRWQRIWIVEVKRPTGIWEVTGLQWYICRTDAKASLEGYGGGLEYRITRYQAMV